MFEFVFGIETKSQNKFLKMDIPIIFTKESRTMCLPSNRGINLTMVFSNHYIDYIFGVRFNYLMNFDYSFKLLEYYLYLIQHSLFYENYV